MVKFKLLLHLALLFASGLAQAETFLYDSGQIHVSAHRGLVNYLDIKGDQSSKPHSKVLDRFRTVINANKPCDLEAQSNIILVCKSFDDDLESAPILKYVERLYAVRKAVCETIADPAEVPSECRKFLSGQSSNMSQKSLLRSELELANSADLDTCTKKLTKHHHFWTSFSNNLGDAVHVCNVLRSDVELRHIIQSYRDFVSDFESLRELLQSLHGHTSFWYHDISEKAQAFRDIQDETFDNFQRGFQNASAEVFEGLSSLESIVSAHKAQVHQLSDQAVKALEVFSEESTSITEGLTKMKLGISELYSEAASKSTSLVEQHMNHVNSLLSLVAQDLDSLGAGFDNLNNQLDEWTRMSDEVVRLQTQQLSNAHQQLSVSELTLDRQFKHYELVNLTHESLQELYNKTQQIKDRYEVYIAIATFLHDYAYLIVTVIVYAILSILLAPFEKTMFGRSVSSIIKAVYCVSQISVFAFDYFQSRIRNFRFSTIASAVVVLLPVVLILTAGLSFLLYSVRLKREAAQTDIEKTRPGQREKLYASVRMSDKQRQRLADTSRSVRGGTTPPGF